MFSELKSTFSRVFGRKIDFLSPVFAPWYPYVLGLGIIFRYLELKSSLSEVLFRLLIPENWSQHPRHRGFRGGGEIRTQKVDFPRKNPI